MTNISRPIPTNFPDYAEVIKYEVALSDMGDHYITATVHIAGNIIPDFSFTWEIEFRGSRYIHYIRQPQAYKDTSTQKAIYTLVFELDFIDDMKSQYFSSYESVSTDSYQGVVVSEYTASFIGAISMFAEMLEKNLDYHFPDKGYVVDLNPTLETNTDQVTFSISDSYIWDVLQQVYDTYGYRWRLETNDDGYPTIKIGYESNAIDHTFKYGFDGGLMKLERSVDETSIYNVVRGRGSSENVPPYYFKTASGDNAENYASDPDAIDELANFYFDKIRSAQFRLYVKGWRAALYGDTLDTDMYADKVTYFAYCQGYDDGMETEPQFKPVEYIRDEESIEMYGEKAGAIADVEEAKPSIQGMDIDGLGRVDEVVAVEAIIVDYSDDAIARSYYDSVTSATINVTMDETPLTQSFSTQSYPYWKITSAPYSFDISAKIPSTGSMYVEIKSINIEVRTYNGVLVSEDDYDISTTSFEKSINTSSTTVTIAGLPTNDYWVYITGSVEITGSTSSSDTSYGFLTELSGARDLSEQTASDTFKPTFDIWIKNIFQSTKSSSETDAEYVERMWNDVVLDDASVSFSSGALSSADYNFLIPKEWQKNIHYDTSKSISSVDGNTYQSHWRLTLNKSTEDERSNIAYVPYSMQNAKAGDYFYLVNVQLPHFYTTYAESVVDDYIRATLAKRAQVDPTWVLTSDHIAMATKSDDAGLLLEQLNIGTMITVQDHRFIDGSEQLHVSTLNLTYSRDSILPSVTLSLTDEITPQISSSDLLSAEISALSAKIGDSVTAQDIMSIGDARYLMKTGQDQKSLSKTEFDTTISSTDARQGSVAGSGWLIYTDSKGKKVIETDNLVVRNEMQVNSLVINQISVQGGKEILCAAEIECTRVDDDDTGYICYFDQKQGSVGNLFQEGDVAYSTVFNVDNTTLKYYKRMVVAVDVNSITLSKDDDFVNGSGIPAEGDVICHYGSYTNSDRRYVIVRDVIGGGNEQMIMDLYSVNTDGYRYYFAGVETGQNPVWQIGDSARGGMRVEVNGNGEADNKVDIWASSFSVQSPSGEYEDVSEQIEAAQTKAETAINNASAAPIIAQYDVIKSEHSSLNAQVTELKANSVLTGATELTTLNTKWSDYASAYTTLTSAIVAVRDSGYTSDRQSTYDTAYASYSTAKSNLTTAITAAQTYITDTIASDLSTYEDIANGRLDAAELGIQDAKDLAEAAQASADKAVEVFEGDYTPTLSNYPASSWTDTDTKDKHINDLFDKEITTDSVTTFERYRFSKVGTTYSWKQIADSGSAAAMAEARNALGIANGKNKTVYSSGLPPTPYSVNDFWIDISDYDTMYICTTARASGSGVASDWQVINNAMLQAANRASDLKVTDEEKLAYRDDIARMASEMSSYAADATSYGVSIASLTTAYNALVAVYNNVFMVTASGTTTITEAQRADHNTKSATYQSERLKFANAISEVIAQGKVDAIEFSGVNLLDGTSAEYKTKTTSYFQYQIYSASLEELGLAIGDTITARCCLRIPDTDATQYQRIMLLTDATAGGTGLAIGNNLPINSEGYSEVSYTIPDTWDSSWNLLIRVYNYPAPATEYVTSEYKELMLVKGNKIDGSWSPSVNDTNTAIQDVQDNVDTLSATVATLDTDVNQAIADGVVDAEEKGKVSGAWEALKSTYAEKESTYTELVSNSYLSTSVATNLTTANTSLTSAYNTLDAAVTALLDGDVTDADRTAYGNAYTAFNTALSNFAEKVELANADIQSNIESASAGYTDTSIENVSFSSVNLLDGTSAEYKTKTTSYFQYQIYSASLEELGLAIGDTITARCCLRIPDTDATQYQRIMLLTDATAGGTGLAIGNNLPINSEGYSEVSYTIPDTWDSSWNLLIRVYNDPVATSYVTSEYKELMLVKGNKIDPTWSESANDRNNKIAAKSATFTQASMPTSAVKNDTWYDTTNSYVYTCIVAYTSGGVLATNWSKVADETKQTVNEGLVLSNGGFWLSSDLTKANAYAGLKWGSESSTADASTRVIYWSGMKPTEINTFVAAIIAGTPTSITGTVITADGTVYSNKIVSSSGVFTNAAVTGVINATEGSIGGFALSNERLGVESEVGTDGVYSNSGMSLTNDLIKFGDGTALSAAIGKSLAPGSVGGQTWVASFTNKKGGGTSTQIGVNVHVSGAAQNIAIAAKGAVAVDGLNTSYNVNKISVPSTSTVILASYSSQHCLVTFSAAGWVGLPTATNVALNLGLIYGGTASGSTPFCVMFDVVCSVGSTSSGSIYGRTTLVNGANTTEHPILRNANGEDIQRLVIAKGDSMRVMLHYINPSSYNAYLLNHNG